MGFESRGSRSNSCRIRLKKHQWVGVLVQLELVERILHSVEHAEHVALDIRVGTGVITPI